MIFLRYFLLLLFLVAFSSSALPVAEAGWRAPKGKKGSDDTQLIVAVAANALRPLMEVTAAYRAAGYGEVKIVHGSTGKLYTQIVQGAPFHIFLAADKERPRLIEQRGMAEEGTRFTYVKGHLALYTSRGGQGIKDNGLAVLTGADVLKVAIANPGIAPYGKAAVEALTRYGIMDAVEAKLVYGENVSQAFSFAKTGNADAAIVALSTLYGQDGDIHVLDKALYDTVVQEGVIIKGAPKGAFDFIEFLKGEIATEIFTKYGYETTGE